MTKTRKDGKLSTGIEGLDDVLGGGFPAGGLYLLQGNPGVGKTTLALQFLLEGIGRGEPALYVTLSETEAEIRGVADAHGWSLHGLTLYELTAAEEKMNRDAEQTMFHPAEVELEETTKPLLDEVDRVKPRRLVIDSLSEIRLLAREPLRYRRQLLAMKQFFAGLACTVLLIDDKSSEGADVILQTLAHGVIQLEKLTPLYGSTRRRIAVEKLRGVSFREGYHDYRIARGGITVFPRLVAAEHEGQAWPDSLSSEVPELDMLLDGGLQRGNSTLLMGSAGTGKSSIVAQFALAAARRGDLAVIHTFDETVATWTTRAESMGMHVTPHLESGRLRVTQVDPAELSPGELAFNLRCLVETEDVRFVAIDSLNGYMHSVPEEGFLLLHLHELLTYLGQKGVTTMMVLAQHGLLGPGMQTPVDISYLADAVVVLRYFEAAGEVRQAISVMKKRSGKHERSIRELRLDAQGIRISAPLKEFHGVLSGAPAYRGGEAPLLQRRDGDGAD